MWPDGLTALAESWVGTAALIVCAGVFLHGIAIHMMAFVEARRQIGRERLADRLSVFEGDPPPVSILIPAFNEAPAIVHSVRALFDIDYPSYEIIVVNDGSTDDTLQALIEAFDLRPSKRTLRARVWRERLRGVYSSPRHPNLIVVDVTRGGNKAVAMNTALAFSRYPYFCALGADATLERDTLLKLMWPFYEDPSTVAVSGVVRPSNGCTITHGRLEQASLPRRPLARFQVVEYLRTMLSVRLGHHLIDALFIVSGRLGVYSRDAVMRVGGYRPDALGVGRGLVTRLQRWAVRNGRPRAVKFVATAVCWTEVPESIHELAVQRARWHQGLAEALWQSRSLIVRRPLQGLACLTQFGFELLGPIVEGFATLLFLALVVAGHGDSSFALVFFLIFVSGATVTSMIGIALEAVCCPRYRGTWDQARLARDAFLENFGYRQLNVLWKIAGLANALVRRPTVSALTSSGASERDAANKAEPERLAA